MLVPKLFKKLFFRKTIETTTIDRIKDDKTIFLCNTPKEQLRELDCKNIRLIFINGDNFKRFAATANQQECYVLVGNHTPTLIKKMMLLEEKGFTNVHTATTLKEVLQIKNLR